LAQSLIHLRAVRKEFTLGTSLRISSVTLEPGKEIQSQTAIVKYQYVQRLPFKLLTHLSSKLRNKLSSDRSKSSGTDGRASLAHKRSIEIPEKSKVSTGTYASVTLANSVTSGRAFSSSNISVKKSSRWICLGATQRVSISEPINYYFFGQLINKLYSTTIAKYKIEETNQVHALQACTNQT
jgi:hypothetical protein